MLPVIVIERDAELTRPVQPEQFHEPLYQGERNAHTYLIHPLHNDVPAELADCTVSGSFLRPDGRWITLTGEVTGDQAASVTLTEACCAVEGRYALLIRVSAANFDAVIYACGGLIAAAQMT